jgi:hypothetical protein
MWTPIKAFFMEPTGRVAISLRRYANLDTPCGASGYSYHNAQSPIGEAMAIYRQWDNREGEVLEERNDIPHTDERWPLVCACGYKFLEDDPWQIFQESIYRRSDNGEEHSLRKLPLGALYYADWYLTEGSSHYRGPDGHCLIAMVPGSKMQPRTWQIDGRANNCTLPNDSAHRCWVRHGDPRTGDVHVDKDGLTCDAGGGSIQTEGWHGFLDHGWLVTERNQPRP